MLFKLFLYFISVKQGYGTEFNPGKSCKDILESDNVTVSGNYWIQISSSKPFQVYCDMETHTGGWTLVYSYTFTNYNSFNFGSNAVTPRPSWPAPGANVPISYTPPLSESSLGAIDWDLWKDIGQEFMVKSNINNWIVCQQNSVGSLVAEKYGSLKCLNIKPVTDICRSRAPYKIFWYDQGPAIYALVDYYFFDGFTGGNWPVHDPCGKAETNHKKEVNNPGGQIYLR